MSFYKAKGAIGLDGLIEAGAGKETIQAAHTPSALGYMADHGMTAKDFGGAKGMVDTAKTIGDIGAFQSQFKQAKSKNFSGSEADFMKTRLEFEEKVRELNVVIKSLNEKLESHLSDRQKLFERIEK